MAMFDQDVIDRANAVMKSKKGGILDPIKKELREARKETMRTMRRYLCDSCDAPILKPEEGYVVHGNIYLADPNQTLGMIGNNFPNEADAKVEQVKKTVLCKKCFNKALTYNPKSPKIDEDSDFGDSNPIF